jgi:hypothetical protein
MWSGSALKIIGERAFPVFCNLNPIDPIPRSVKMLSKECFRGCESLEDLTFESGSELNRIDADVFFE